jgi:DNA-binding GntR family transcriptional regulator
MESANAPTDMTSTLSQSNARASRSDDVYTCLKKDIGEFRLVPGDRFTEHEISARLGVSRTPVRQALFQLQQEGYVEVMFRSGWRVLPFDFDKFEQLYDLRMILETAAIERLCADAVQSHVKTHRALIDNLATLWLVPMEQRCTDARQVTEWDEEFHCTLVAATGNAEMVRVHKDVTERIRIIRRLDFTQASRINTTYDEHAKILNAILKNRGDAAAMLLRSHISTSQSEVRKITLHQLHMARQMNS